MSPAVAKLTPGVGRRRPERAALPEISRFFGISIYIHPNDHSPPHFHAQYEGRDVSVAIKTLQDLQGSIRRRAMGLVTEWAELHRDELLAAWNAIRSGRAPDRIAPLD